MQPRDQRIQALYDAAIELARRRHRSPLAADVAALSRQFTAEKGTREPGYLRRPPERRAYLGWFAPRNAARIGLLLDELVREGRVPAYRRPSVLDLGAGPLAGVLGAWVAFGAVSRATAVDLAAPALDDGERLLAAVGAEVERVDVRVANLTRTSAWGAGTYDLVIIANSLGEVGDPRRDVGRRALVVEQALARLAQGGRVLVVEPGTRIHGQALMRVRDALVERAHGAVLAPCTGARSCPLLRTPGGWCHDELPWRPPPSAEALAREAGLSTSPLKHSYLLLAREAEGAHGLRLVGGLMSAGGVERRYTCTRDGLVEIKRKGALPEPMRTARRGAWLERAPDDVEVGQGPSRKGQRRASARRRRDDGP